MTVPTVSIGLPVYNGERFVAEAIESVINQTYTEWELIIVDNASTDNTGDICREFAAADPRIHYYRNPANVGLARNFNEAFRRSTARFFRWQAHDDVLDPKFLSSCLSALEEHPGAALAYPTATAIDESGCELPEFDFNADPPCNADSAVARFESYVLPARPTVARYIFGLTTRDNLAATRLMMSHMWADVTLLSELLLQGPFVHAESASIRLRVFDGHASSLMGKKQLRAWQQVLDPRYARPGLLTVARYRRYPEHIVSVWREGSLRVSERVRLTVFCLALPFHRLPMVLRRAAPRARFASGELR